MGSINASGNKPKKMTVTTAAGTAVTLTITGGSATFMQDASGDGNLDLALQSTGKSTKVAIATRGGDNAVTFDSVTVTGALAQFTAKTATLAGLFSASGAVKNLKVAQIIGTFAAAGPIGSVTVGALTNADILSGATFTAGSTLADANYSTGSIASVKVTGAISDSIIAAGAGPDSAGVYATTGDQDFGGYIGTITAKGGADANSLFIASTIRHAKLPKPLTIPADPRFVLL